MLSNERTTGDDRFPLALVGCDFRRGSARFREALILHDADAEKLRPDLVRNDIADGLLVLETCNRNEWIVSTRQPLWAAQVLRAQMIERWRANPATATDSPHPEPYVILGVEAVRHVLRVATGLESFVEGEPQIAGQFNRAIEAARHRHISSPILNGLGTVVGRVTRDLGKLRLHPGHGRGVHGLAIEQVARVAEGAVKPVIGIVGLGEIGRKAATLADDQRGWTVLRYNRTPRPGAHSLTTVIEHAPALKAIIVATGSPTPVLDANALWQQNPNLLIVDIGIPRQVAHDGTPDDRLLDLDRLFNNDARRLDTATRARIEDLVDRGIAEFGALCKRRELTGVLERTQELYGRYTHGDIPEAMRDTLRDLPEADRKRIERQVQRLFRLYTHHIIEAVHDTAAAQATLDLRELREQREQRELREPRELRDHDLTTQKAENG